MPDCILNDEDVHLLASALLLLLLLLLATKTCMCTNANNAASTGWSE
jgi:hypothetical protein